MKKLSVISRHQSVPDENLANPAVSESTVSDISARQKPLRFSKVAVNWTDWFWEMDKDLKFTYQSELFEQVTGIAVDQVIGKTREQAFAGLIDDAAKWQRLGTNLIDHEDYSMVWALNCPDGTTKLLRTIGKPFFNPQGDFMGYRGVGSDITESIQMIDALAFSEARFKDFAKVAADWFFELDENLVITYISGEKYPPSGQNVSELFGVSYKDSFQGQLDKIKLGESHFATLEAHEPFEISYEWQRVDGTVMYGRTRGHPIFDEAGSFKGYRGCGTDETDTKTAEKLVRESEKQYRKIIENVTDIIVIADQDGQLSFQNKTIYNLLGFSPEDLADKYLGDLVIPEDRAQLIMDTREAFDNPGKIIRTIYRCPHKDGSLRVFEATRQRIIDPDSSRSEIVIHARDITSQKLAEDALHESEQRLRDFAETAADWFWEQDAELRFTFLSNNFSDFSAVDNSKYLGKTRQQAFPSIDFTSEKWTRLYERLNQHLAFDNFEYEFIRNDGKTLTIRTSGKPIFDKNGEFSGYRGSGIDVTESHLLAQKLNFQASHDPLTGLVNRREFEKRLTRIISQSHKDQSHHALCYIDLDQFKVVNDTCGHEAGDELLQQIASVVKTKLRRRDTIARLGGDEFGLLLERCDIEHAAVVAESVRHAIETYRFIYVDKSFKIGASIGLIPINECSGNYTEVMRNADAACYAAKDAGRNNIHIYDVDNVEVAQRHEEMQRIVDITHAFDDERFVLYQQAIMSLKHQVDMHNNYCEILVRMVDETGKILLPESFLPAAERYNLVKQLDTWVVTQSINWLEREKALGRMTNCSINLSGMSVADETFLQFVLDKLDSSKIEAAQICFEITETAVIANLSAATRFIERIRGKGCYLALDDFGSGLSSFAYLKTLAVDFLKIDGFFVRDILNDKVSYEMVKSINDIGHVMGKKTIAEFVENEQIMEALREIGVDYAQGYTICRPGPLPN